MEEKTKVHDTHLPADIPHSGKKRLCIIAGIIIAIFIIFLFILLRDQNNKAGNLTALPTGAPQQNTQNPKSPASIPFNPLINPKEVDRVESALKKQFEKAGITISPKKYKFHYKLAPELQNKSSFRFVKSAIAANTCNISSAPSTLPIYSLQDHLTVVDAKAIAATYDITTDPTGSLPSLDGTSYDYFFSDAVVSQFLSVSENSGVSYWHRVVDENGTITGAGTPESIASGELTKHKLADNAVLKNTTIDPATGHTVFHYEKNYNDLIMTDKTSILALGASSPVCSVAPTTLMNFIDIHVTKNNYFQKLINKTRQVLQGYPIKRASLEESLAEYPTSLVDPVVIGGTDTSGDITIDEAVLVWYDYGEMMPQTAYIPMYLTSGHAPSGARVLSLFPALTKQTMNDTKIPQLSSASRDTLQLYTFNPPLAKPPPPLNPGKGTPYPTIPGLGSVPVCSGGSSIGSGGSVIAGGSSVGLATSIGGTCPSGDSPGTGLTLGSPGTPIGGCYGGVIDYTLRCTESSGLYVCSTAQNGLPTDNTGKNDPFGVCKNGPQIKSETFDLPAGSNPCDEFRKKYNFPIQFQSDLMPSYKGGPVVCYYYGTPC